MDRLTKLVVFVSMTTGLIVEATLMASGWSAILPLTIATLATFCLLSLRFAELAAALVLLFTYTFPAIVFAFRGRFEFGYMTIWVAALLGVMLPGLRKAWALPARWRSPLVLWALTVALLWPVVALREIDFAPITLEVARSVTGPPGVPPPIAILWIVNVALVLGVGILWFDWLCATFDGAERRFRLVVIGALAASWLATTLVGIYQLLFDMTFLNSGRFGFLQRASGMMLDANPFGVVAALGLPAIAALALRTSWKGRGAAIVAVAALDWAAVWASGSRTALAAGFIVTAFVLYYWADLVMRRGGVTRRVVVTGTVIVLAAIFVPLLLQRLSAVGAWRRMAESLPTLTIDELWNRNGYGLAASRMIGDFPAFGVGVGAFHYLVLDYSAVVIGRVLPVDNAQNWYRHQLAEFGVLGSLGWILWTLSFGWFVLTTRVSGETRWAAGAIKGALVAIALISLVSMPTQNVGVTVTLWTLMFWFASLTGEQPHASGTHNQTPMRTWLAVWLVVVMSVTGTAYSARHDLRVPQRAARGNWPYSYGFYDPERDPDGREFRWTQQRAVVVLPTAKRWMLLTVSVNHPDLANKPVDVRVWRDESIVLTTTLRTPEPLTEYVRIPDGEDRFVLETWVSRVGRPKDFGASDPRTLGLMVQWDFVDAPSSRDR